jgi:TPR repeat protein
VAWRVFTEKMGTWWPLGDYKIGKAKAVDAIIEPRVGCWYERGDDGSTTDWGTVLAWEPTTRLVPSWDITADWQYDPNLKTEIAMELAGRHALRKARAADYFKRACDRAWPAGCERLGSLLWANHHPEDDVAAAAAWEQACTAGLPKWCQHLADALARGKRIAPDGPKAQALTDRACTEGFPPLATNGPLSLVTGGFCR